MHWPNIWDFLAAPEIRDGIVRLMQRRHSRDLLVRRVAEPLMDETSLAEVALRAVRLASQKERVILYTKQADIAGPKQKAVVYAYDGFIQEAPGDFVGCAWTGMDAMTGFRCQAFVEMPGRACCTLDRIWDEFIEPGLKRGAVHADFLQYRRDSNLDRAFDSILGTAAVVPLWTLWLAAQHAGLLFSVNVWTYRGKANRAGDTKWTQTALPRVSTGMRDSRNFRELQRRIEHDEYVAEAFYRDVFDGPVFRGGGFESNRRRH